jgi:uncharacterized delta-60 repeat protein
MAILSMRQTSAELDSNFGTAGIVFEGNGSADQSVQGKAIVVGTGGQNDQFYVAGAQRDTVVNAMFVRSYVLASGTMNNQLFSDDLTTFNGDDVAEEMVLGSNRGAIVAGYAQGPSNPLTAVWRASCCGDLSNLDGSFGNLGGLEAEQNGVGRGIARDSSDRVLVAGGSGSGNTEFAVFRYTSAGNIDGSFATSGVFKAPDLCDTSAAVPAEGRAVTQGKGGKIIVAGVCVPKNNPDAAGATLVVMQLTDSGNLDTDFGGGTGAIFIYSFEQTGLEVDALDMKLDESGRIVVTGSYVTKDGNSDMIVLRLKP